MMGPVRRTRWRTALVYVLIAFWAFSAFSRMELHLSKTVVWMHAGRVGVEVQKPGVRYWGGAEPGTLWVWTAPPLPAVQNWPATDPDEDDGGHLRTGPRRLRASSLRWWPGVKDEGWGRDFAAPLWMIGVAAYVPGMVRRARLWKRRRSCASCGYDLSGLVRSESGVMCPECGVADAGPAIRGWRGWVAFPREAELALLFLVAPTVLAVYMRPGLLFPALWVLAAGSVLLLLMDPGFERRKLWNARGVAREWKWIALRFVVCAPLLAVVLFLMSPERLLSLPVQRPGLWAVIMVAYPVFSVYPQEVAFRAMVMHRYAGLFRSVWMLVAVNAVVFGYAHIIMHNWWAVAFSAVGGVFFGLTYRRSGSLAAACLEHALYGCFLFTIGWGSFFYSGAVR
ncbi:MAG: CPBP family intramembrane metalloprotease [Phycisphaerales bacterium]|nr:CPBP family intramembrane metalloprotease [Phycisphaerales bacterium]